MCVTVQAATLWSRVIKHHQAPPGAYQVPTIPL